MTDGKAMNQTPNLKDNNKQPMDVVSSDGSRDRDTNTSMKDTMDQTCISKNTAEKEGQQPIDQSILVTSDNLSFRFGVWFIAFPSVISGICRMTNRHIIDFSDVTLLFEQWIIFKNL
jgi:hypothetical protein